MIPVPEHGASSKTLSKFLLISIKPLSELYKNYNFSMKTLSKVYQNSRKFYQKFIKSLSKVYQKFIKNLSKFYKFSTTFSIKIP